MQSNSVFIHPTAIIDPGATIGSGSKVWHFCHISSTSQVGRDCHIGQNVFIDKNCSIGNGVKIQNNVSVYNGVTIEDDVFLGPSMVFTNVLTPRSFISRKADFIPTIIRKGVSIGANATILCGIEIGNYAMVGAGAVVTRNVVPYALVTGNPAQQTGWVSEAGLRLQFDPQGEAVCPYSGKKYRLQNGIIDPGQ